MADLMACWDTLLIDGTDIRVIGAYITSAEGLLAYPPQGGDLIEQDWTAGAIWQQGPRRTYSFEVPVMMISHDQDVAIGQLRALQGYVGRQLTVTRQLTVNGADIAETCQAVMIDAIEVNWDFERRRELRAVCVFQNLSAAWV